jgi:hypothetical protein
MSTVAPDAASKQCNASCRFGMSEGSVINMI